jgi:hypothetical protein
MVIKGNARAGAKSLAAHVLRADTNERVEVDEIRGVIAEDVEGALREMEAVACCTRTSKPLYHASINTRADERLTPEQRLQAIDRLEEALNLTGQPRVVVIHEKKGREHCHIIWSRTDLDKSIAIRMDHNFRTHELVARELEREFGHERVQGAHVERDGKPRPARTPGHDEMQQASRTGLKPKEAKEQVTAVWRSTDSGQAFQAAIEEKGWILARGDRRDFVVVDPQGGTHSLARRVDGAKAKDVRERMADLDASALPTVQEARTIQTERQAERKPPEPDRAEDEQRRQRAPVSDGLDWTDRAGMAAQQRSALNAVKANERAAADPRAGKTLKFSEDRKSSPKPVTKPERESGEKRLKFLEDKKPDKDIDRDR